MVMEVTKARLGDARVIRSLIDCHAKKGRMLSRSLSYIYENLRSFYVVKAEGQIIGCASLAISWEDLAEVKSLAVHKDYAGRGAGKLLLDAIREEAAQMGLKRIFTLTLEPEYFRKQGFKVIPMDCLPMKIWGECRMCPKYPDCDETALEYTIEK
jgi:amino-acid N-acetyltransferase